MNKTAVAVIMSYVAGGWTFIELSHFVLERYYISNVWVDVFILLLLSMSPSVAILAFYQTRRKLKKFFIPSNGLVSSILILIVFIDKPLGTYAKSVEIINEKGVNERITGIKENFRIKVGIAEFDNVSDIDSLEWMKWGLVDLLKKDLEYSDLFFVVDQRINSAEGINKILKAPAAIDLDYLILGTISTNDKGFATKYDIHDSQGSIITGGTVHAENIFQFVDSFSQKITQSIKLPKGVSSVKNLPIESITTNSFEALKKYYQAYPWNSLGLMDAIRLDSTFVYSYYQLAISIGMRGSKELFNEAKEIMAMGLPHRHKLSESGQLGFLIEYYRYADMEKAHQLAMKMIELYPDNYYKTEFVGNVLLSKNSYFPDFKNYLLSVYDQLEHGRKVYYLKVSSYHADIDLLKLINDEIGRDPLDTEWLLIKATVLYSMKDFASAKKVLEEIALIKPTKKELTDMIIGAMENYDLVDLTGDYSYGSYTRRFTTNRMGIPFVVFSHYNNQVPCLILDKHRFYVGVVDSIYYDDNNEIYATTATWGDGSVAMLYKQEDELDQLEQAIAENDYAQARELIEFLVNKYPRHYYLKEYKKHIDFIRSGMPIDSSILGSYESVGSFVSEEGKILLVGDLDLGGVRLLPVSPMRFQFLNTFDSQLEYIKEDSVSFIQIWEYNPLSNESTAGQKTILPK